MAFFFVDAFYFRPVIWSALIRETGEEGQKGNLPNGFASKYIKNWFFIYLATFFIIYAHYEGFVFVTSNLAGLASSVSTAAATLFVLTIAYFI